MGYACPVCETPQRDGEHLAHHLAFTAMLHGDDHEDWLDERVPDWSDRGPAGLAADVTPHAESAEYHEVFEDTVDRGRPNVDVGAHDHAHDHANRHDHNAGHGHAHGHGHDPSARSGVVDRSGASDPETAEALREARELTREMLADDADSEGDDGERDNNVDRDSNGDRDADSDCDTNRDRASDTAADRNADDPSA